MSTSTSEDAEEQRNNVPHRFVQLITTSLGHSRRLSLPRSFLHHSGHNLRDTVRLIGYDGIICNIQLERVNNNIYLARGWPQFFDHHNLQDGYVLEFEYTGNSTFNVSIFEDSGVEVTYESETFEDELSPNDNPIFRVTLQANRNAHRRIDIPGAFARVHLPKYVQNIQIHDRVHRNWPMRTNLRRNGDVHRLSTGWSAYVREKQLQMGDTCVFELLNNDTPMFIVYKVCPTTGSWTLT